MKKELEREKRLVDDLSELSEISESFLIKYDDIYQTFQDLQLTDGETEIVAKLAELKKVIDDLRKNETSLKHYKDVLTERVESLREAKILEDFGDFQGAARAYALCGEYLKAARFYQKAQNFDKAGDSYYSAGDFERAVKMYKKGGQPHDKMALAYENLGDYRQAAMIWKELGKIKESQRCMRKVNQLSLFDEW
jgi:tetratricopeptide (TPR) repeat protein